MKSKLFETMLIDIFKNRNGAASHSAAFLQTINFTIAVRLLLAHHVVVVVRKTPRTNEKGCGKQWGCCSANLLNGGNVVGKRSSVDVEKVVVNDFSVGHLGRVVGLVENGVLGAKRVVFVGNEINCGKVG